MHTLYLISVILHIVSAIVWVGGMLFMTMVLVPAIRQPGLREHAVRLIKESGRRFKRVGWACLITLVVTGFTNLYLKGYGQAMQTGEFWTSPFGLILAHKIALVVLIIILAIVHDIWVGPRAVVQMEAAPDQDATQRLRKRASWMGRINLLLSLIVVILAIILVRIWAI
jgi:putative copper resistance protein D